MRKSTPQAFAMIGATAVLLLYNLPSGWAGSNDDTVLKADRSFVAALAKPDAKSLGDYLDTTFAWTDVAGNTLNKSAVLLDAGGFAADNRDDADSRVYSYTQLGLVYGTHHSVRYVRIWVKKPNGWLLSIDLDTPTASEGRGTGAGGQRAEETSKGDCDNPCRTLPYAPATAADKAVLTEWQKTKVDEWHPDAADWETHIADEFMIINNGSARDKPDRVALAKKNEAAGIGAPGAPILKMEMRDYGDAALMISHHVPYQGGKPYYNVRVFVNRDGHWPLVWSQQTTIQGEPAMPPVNAKK